MNTYTESIEIEVFGYLIQGRVEVDYTYYQSTDAHSIDDIDVNAARLYIGDQKMDIKILINEHMQDEIFDQVRYEHNQGALL